MSCLLPPACLFCVHYHHDAGHDAADCDAFHEIPDEIFRGDFDHCHPYPGDREIRFELAPAAREDFMEINALRPEMGMKPYSCVSASR